jgi:hypothetical protein
MRTSCLSGSNKSDWDYLEVTICLLGLATSSRIWRGRSRGGRLSVQRVSLCTLHRQQADNVVGNRQQGEGAEISYTASESLMHIERLADLLRETAGKKGKLLSFIPCITRRQQANNLESKGRRGFQDRNQVQAPMSPCKNERCGLDVSTTPGAIQDTCKERSRPLRQLQEESN